MTSNVFNATTEMNTSSLILEKTKNIAISSTSILFSQATFYAHRAVMAVSSEFFAARVNDSVVRLDDSVEPQEFKACYRKYRVTILDIYNLLLT